jgi:hypothetical protein
MMGKKKLSEIKAQLEALSAHPPGKPPEAASSDTKRIVQRHCAPNWNGWPRKPASPKHGGGQRSVETP